jgi:hypothetical protein
VTARQLAAAAVDFANRSLLNNLSRHAQSPACRAANHDMPDVIMPASL